MSTSPLASVILAAGRGRRMGQPKALLTWKGATFLEHMVDLQHKSGISEIVIVTIPSHIDELQRGMYPLAFDSQVERSELSLTWIEGDPEEEQLSSLHRGLAALSGSDASHVLVGPVDQGPYPTEIAAALLAARSNSNAQAWLPTFDGSPGHPVLLEMALAREIPSTHEQGLRGFLRARSDLVEQVPVDFSEVLRNLNTPDRYRSFLEES
ncbi:MAG: nucleotidyltransferase family protein [Deltaproteobacteria bacterium]|nr:MAG: nucleotidyltransferase family protein [Deltaproteobacteria bacterium]